MKKLIICCDGTWCNSDNGFVRDSYFPWNKKGHLAIPSNVTRICRAMKTIDSQNVPQIIYYQAGVGTGDSLYDQLIGGGTGLGLAEHIREAYGFLTNNYMPGDQIFLIGFSRGAFTARSIAGLISLVGICTKQGMESFYTIFKDYENNDDKTYKASGKLPFENRPNIKDPAYLKRLVEIGCSTDHVDIQAVGVWDTVGSLGIPMTGLGALFQEGNPNKEYMFHDTSLTDNIKNAFQALALDETRGAFSPAVWSKPPDVSTNLKQVWFPGVHSNVGGGYDDQELSDITLTWMVSQLSAWIDFEHSYLVHEYEQTHAYAESIGQKIRAWAHGHLYNSMQGVTSLFGSYPRTPGNYMVLDPDTGKATTAPLVSTNERVHPSVRVRYGHGPGMENKGVYYPPALQGWQIVESDHKGEDLAVAESTTDFAWKYTGPKKLYQTELPEDLLGPLEMRLLERHTEQVVRYKTNK